jgi:hypothetical protein
MRAGTQGPKYAQQITKTADTKEIFNLDQTRKRKASCNLEDRHAQGYQIWTENRSHVGGSNSVVCCHQPSCAVISLDAKKTGAV